MAALGLLAATAGAAPAANSSGEELFTRRVVREYGACMVRHHHDRLKAFVLASDGTVQPPAPLPDCVGHGGMLRMSGAIYRMVFAEALLRRDFKDGLPRRLLAGRPDEPGVPTGAMLLADAMEVSERLDMLGRCVAYRRPADALTLIASYPGAPTESTAVGALMPTLTACGVRGVLPQSINNIRGAIAVGLYRAAIASSEPVAPSRR